MTRITVIKILNPLTNDIMVTLHRFTHQQRQNSYSINCLLLENGGIFGLDYGKHVTTAIGDGMIIHQLISRLGKMESQKCRRRGGLCNRTVG